MSGVSGVCVRREDSGVSGRVCVCVCVRARECVHLCVCVCCGATQTWAASLRLAGIVGSSRDNREL